MTEDLLRILEEIQGALQKNKTKGGRVRVLSRISKRLKDKFVLTYRHRFTHNTSKRRRRRIVLRYAPDGRIHAKLYLVKRGFQNAFVKYFRTSEKALEYLLENLWST